VCSLPARLAAPREAFADAFPPRRSQGFLLAVELKIHAAPLKEVGLNDEQIQKLVAEAHKMCPYSRAVEGNVAVKLTVV